MLQPGLYEQVVNNALSSELSEIPEARKSTAPIDTAEASKVLAQYLTDVVQKGLENVQDNGGGLEAQIQLANQIVNTIQNTTQEADFASLGVDQRAEQLLALLRDNDPRLATGKSAKELERPETSIAQSSLFTGAIHEPQIYYADMEPHIGSEQGGKRPVVVLQNNIGNRHSPTLIVATVTTRTEKKKNQPTHVLVDSNPAFEEPSMILLEQIFTIDKSRIERFMGYASKAEMLRIDMALLVSLALNVLSGNRSE